MSGEVELKARGWCSHIVFENCILPGITLMEDCSRSYEVAERICHIFPSWMSLMVGFSNSNGKVLFIIAA